MITPERLKEIKERCEKAPEDPVLYDKASGSRFMRIAAKEFYDEARTDIPDLVAEVETLYEKCSQLCYAYGATLLELAEAREEIKRLKQLAGVTEEAG